LTKTTCCSLSGLFDSVCGKVAASAAIFLARFFNEGEFDEYGVNCKLPANG